MKPLLSLYLCNIFAIQIVATVIVKTVVILFKIKYTNSFILFLFI